MSDRAARITAFLAAAGWADGVVHPLAGDASSRRYHRVDRGAERAILMDAPPGICGSQEAFLRMARHLRALGLAAPDVLAVDPEAGFYLLEDLGETVAAARIARDPACEFEIYDAAARVLLRMQRSPCPDWAAPYGPGEMAAAIRPAWTHYLGQGGAPSPAWMRLERILYDLLSLHDMAPVLIHRDYHAENLIWRPERTGLARIGLLDFQDALAGHPAYDLASLLQDARRDVSPAVETEIIRCFARETSVDEAAFGAAYSVQAAQRHLRILGIFARLADERGKPGYLRLVPRVRRDLARAIAHPALEDLRAAVEDVLPRHAGAA